MELKPFKYCYYYSIILCCNKMIIISFSASNLLLQQVWRLRSLLGLLRGSDFPHYSLNKVSETIVLTYNVTHQLSQWKLMDDGPIGVSQWGRLGLIGKRRSLGYVLLVDPPRGNPGHTLINTFTLCIILMCIERIGYSSQTFFIYREEAIPDAFPLRRSLLVG